MESNIDKLKKLLANSLRFNNKYSLQFLEPISYEKVSDIFSAMRKNKEVDSEQFHTVSSIYQVFYLNFFKIKNLEDAEPRKIAQQFIGKKKIRLFIMSRDGNRCLKCSSTKKLQLDHIVPVSKGGQNKLSNLQTLCNSCNSKKRDNFHDYRSNILTIKNKIANEWI